LLARADNEAGCIQFRDIAVPTELVL
jgi:hypothetical protein